MEGVLQQLLEFYSQGTNEDQLEEITLNFDVIRQDDLNSFVERSAEFIVRFVDNDPQVLELNSNLLEFLCEQLGLLSCVEWQQTHQKVKQRVKEILATLCIADKKSGAIKYENHYPLYSLIGRICQFDLVIHSTFIWNPILDLLQRELIPEGIPAALVILKEMFDLRIDNFEELRSLDELPEITYFLESTIQSIGPAFQGAVALLTGIYSVLSEHAPEAMKRNVKCIITALFDQKCLLKEMETYAILCCTEDLIVGDILDEASFRNMPEEILKKIISQIIIILIHYPPSKIGEITEEEKKMSSLLDLIAVTAPSTRISNILFSEQTIPRLITSSEWKEVHASLVMLAVTAEGCKQRILADLSLNASWVFSCFRHEHPQVRFAACTALGQFCTDLAPDIQKQFSSQIVDTLLFGMEDEEGKIAHQATTAMVNYFQESDDISQAKRFLEVTLKQIRTKGVLSKSMFTAVASIVESNTSSNELTNEYEEIIPTFLALLKDSKENDTNSLVEAISIFAVLESFAPYAKEFLSFLIEWRPDCESRFFQACMRLVFHLKEEFLVYFPIILPRVIAIKDITLDIEAVPEDSKEEWVEFETHGQRLGFLVDKSRTKLEGISLLAHFCALYPKHMIRIGMGRFLEMISDFQIGFISPEVKESYCFFFTRVLDLYAADKQMVYQALRENEDFIGMMLGDDIGSDSDMLCFLSDVMRSVNKPFLNGEQQDRVISLVINSLCQFEKTKDLKSSHVIDALDLLDDCIKRHPGMVKDCHSIWNFLQLCFDRFLDQTELIEGTMIIFDVIVEYGASDLSYMWENQIPKVLALAQHSAGIRQAVVYGIGIIAEHHTEVFNKHKKAMTDIILDSLKNETVTSVKDNAVFALGKIIQFQHSPVSVKTTILDCWVNNLPSLDEAEACNKQLLYFLQSFPLEIGGKEGKKLENLWDNFMVMHEKRPAKGLAHEIIFEFATNCALHDTEHCTRLCQKINDFSKIVIKKTQ